MNLQSQDFNLNPGQLKIEDAKVSGYGICGQAISPAEKRARQEALQLAINTPCLNTYQKVVEAAKAYHAYIEKGE